MKKLLIILVVFVYSVPVTFFLTFLIIAQGADDYYRNSGDSSSAIAAFAIPIIFMIVVCGLVVVNFIAAIVSASKGKCLSFRTIMVFKLCVIPFYLVNFACWTIASMVFHIALFVWFLIPFIIMYTYFTMLGTSVYVICSLFNLRRCGMISTKQLVVHCILQTIFTVDVIDSIYLAVKQKRFEPVLQESSPVNTD